MSTSNSINNSWRRVTTAIYRKPLDSKIFGTVEVDVTDLEHYIAQKRKEGLKITLTHIVTLAVARAIREGIPELNAYVRRGNVVPRKQIDAMVSVLIRNAEMSSIKIPNADTLTINELAEIMNEEIRQLRSGSGNKTMQLKDSIGRVPWPIRTWIIRFIKTVTVDWGLPLPFLKLKPDSFGSYLISNIGTLGLDFGYPALFPISNVPLVLIMGGVYKKPYVVNDEILPRRIMTLSVALDHRVVDAAHGGMLFRYIKKVINNPKLLEVKP
jgi:pyruvate/2-oxoglutarate dehydrogenase complex dihydrolipoamide acyltransferase (E2) component